MARYVIRFGIGTDNTKVFLSMVGKDFGTTTRQRQAIEFSSRKEAVDIQKWLLTVRPTTFNRIIHKDKHYTDHVAVSVVSGDLEIRNKLYDYFFEVNTCS